MPFPTGKTVHLICRRFVATTGRLALTAAITVFAGGMVVGGRSILADRAQSAPISMPAPASPVTVARIAMQGHHVAQRRFSGQFEARQRIGMAFERAGTLEAVLVREGDVVAEGEVVARLDMRLLRAERARLGAARAGMMAEAELARRTNARQAELRDRGFATEQRLDDTSLSLARFEAAIAGIDAARDAVDIEMSKAALIAPFAGTVEDRVLDVGAIAAAGSPVVDLIEAAPPRFRVSLDPRLAEALHEDVDAVIEVGGLRLPGRLSRLAPSLDPATRGRTAWFDVVTDLTLPDLTTGEIAFAQWIEGAGAWVPLSALSAGPQATWTLLTVEDGVVGVEAAEVLYIEGDRAFVRGTFRDGDAYLPSGTHRVVPGQTVDPAPATVADQPETIVWER
ncbi:RND family efflux transporter, MFP subunit [Jannaschia faecimaris]|uniref:RND family efflux transporter, MFP subunit n=1 Tax=Jannaschia faecimaris TaxID=1244108 RepID=A0A1H3U1R5_9RHOB|nr:efflux RND transporter periplasmic adaptor subunit [Jannaschia faecimaris]SDZ56396.1 RND family efflux transporter, MFP subunit [Jannaschia faecimaris]